MNIAAVAGMSRLTAQSEHSQLRKAYLKLSLMIHPDKLQSKFAQATTAFQACTGLYQLSIYWLNWFNVGLLGISQSVRVDNGSCDDVSRRAGRQGQ